MTPLETARANQSSQTGFVHQGDVIPIYENLCFALALFRSHVGEQVEEGKKLLKRLLGFFSEGFPLYLHEYPNLGLPAYQIRCALPFHWILKLYSHVIEPSLKKSLRGVYERLLEQQEEMLSPLYQILLATLQGKEIPTYNAQFSHEWGLLLLAYQIAEEKPNWILKGALKCWHPELMTYSAPALQEYQCKTQPETTLYDLFMAEHQGKNSKRMATFPPIQGALVFPFKMQQSQEMPSLFQIVSKNEEWNEKGFHLMRFLWGTSDRIHSLVCQDKMCLKQKGEKLLFTYPQEVPHEKERMELSFFTEYEGDVQLFVEGKKQTVFHLGEVVEIQTVEKTVKLLLTLEKGEGHFIGHISRGNRLAQTALKGSKDFTSYDWKIGLRSINRTDDLVIGLRVL